MLELVARVVFTCTISHLLIYMYQTMRYFIARLPDFGRMNTSKMINPSWHGMITGYWHIGRQATSN